MPKNTHVEAGGPRAYRRASVATECLREEMDRLFILPNGETITGWRAIAEMIRELVLTGIVHMPNGRVEHLEWKEQAKWMQWLYNRVDGLPKATTTVEAPGIDWPKFIEAGTAAPALPLVERSGEEESVRASSLASALPPVAIISYEQFVEELITKRDPAEVLRALASARRSA